MTNPDERWTDLPDWPILHAFADDDSPMATGFELDRWECIGCDVAEEGFTLPFSPDYDPLPPMPPSSGDTGGLGEGERATLAILGFIAIAHGLPLLGLVIEIVKGWMD